MFTVVATPTRLSLDEHFIKRPAATFFVTVEGDGMDDQGIRTGDTLIVDRPRTPGPWSIVVAVIDGELSVRPFSALDREDACVSSRRCWLSHGIRLKLSLASTRMPKTHHSLSWPSASWLRRMECADTMRTWTHHHIQIDGRVVDYRVARSKTARRLRLRVGPSGVDVVQPTGRSNADVAVFLENNGVWILDQLRRVARLRGLGQSSGRRTSEILFRGESTRVPVEATETRRRGNAVDASGGEIVLRRGANSQTPVARSLETWLRKQARAEIQRHLAILTTRLRESPRRVLVMDQRTKWGNCSARKNLSFNWRLILAPDFILRYLVTHEAVHLAVPDHSAKFWLTVQSLCPETERAKQWLGANQAKMGVDLERLF